MCRFHADSPCSCDGRMPKGHVGLLSLVLRAVAYRFEDLIYASPGIQMRGWSVFWEGEAPAEPLIVSACGSARGSAGASPSHALTSPAIGIIMCPDRGTQQRIHQRAVPSSNDACGRTTGRHCTSKPSVVQIHSSQSRQATDSVGKAGLPSLRRSLARITRHLIAVAHFCGIHSDGRTCIATGMLRAQMASVERWQSIARNPLSLLHITEK